MAAGLQLFLCLCVSSVLVNFCTGNRKVTTTILNPSTDDCVAVKHCQGIGYIQATGDSDTLHYLVTGLGVPTMLVLYTNTVTNPGLSVDWEKLLSGNMSETAKSIHFMNSKVELKYSYAILFTRVIEYNDTKDVADMTQYDESSTAWNIYDLQDIMWENITTESSPMSNTIKLVAKKKGELFQSNGTLSFQFRAYDDDGREWQLPHLQYSDNITQVDMTIDHVFTQLSMSRFAVESIVVGGEKKVTQKLDMTESIDDEYAPGVFKIFNWLTGGTDQAMGGFFQWKPVCYMKSARARGDATFLKHYGLHDLGDTQQEMLEMSVVYGFHGNMWTTLSTTASNFSFGIGKDGGYLKTNYTSWSGSVGYGVPPSDAVSTLVIIVISAGLGLPVIIMTIGGVYVCVKKRNNKEPKPLVNVSRDYQPVLN